MSFCSAIAQLFVDISGGKPAAAAIIDAHHAYKRLHRIGIEIRCESGY